MKHFGVSFLILMLLFCLACTTAEAPGPTVEPTAMPIAEPTPEPVMLFGEAIRSDADHLALSMPVDSFDEVETALRALPYISEIQVAFSAPWTDDVDGFINYLAFRSAHPDLRFSEQYPDGGAPSETKKLTLDAPVDALDTLLAQLPALEMLTLPEGTPRETVASVLSTFPALRVLWTDAVYGPSDSRVETLTLSGDTDPANLAAYLACRTGLRTVDLREATLSEADGNALCDAFPDIEFLRTVTLPVSARRQASVVESDITELNLDEAEILDYDAFSDVLRYLPRLVHTEMNDCSLNNEQLAALRERYPEKGIVWTVHVRGRSIRTDTIAYSSKQYKDNTNRFTSEHCAPLRYCTDLIALDLGHNAITDLSWIEPLQNLQVLILADNKIRDLTPLKQLQKLKYLEIFMNPLEEIDPIGELPELLDCNLCFTHATDLTPLYACKKLERIWLVGMKITEKDLQDLKQVFPNADISYFETGGSTNSGWREHPRYFAYIEMFRTNQPVAPFLP